MLYNALIKKIRLEKGYSLRKVAEKTGFSHPYLSQLENNRTTHKEDIRVPIETLQTICNGLGYPFRQFLEEADYIQPLQPKFPRLEELADKMNEKQRHLWTHLGEHILNEDIASFLVEVKNLEDR